MEHIPFTPAPDYLYFTSKAYMGIVTYESYCLNNIYCAPNKIFEYASFGVHMLANNIPSLKYTVEYSGCGSTYNDEKDVQVALNHIIENRSAMSEKVIRFFNDTDYKKIRISILESLK